MVFKTHILHRPWSHISTDGKQSTRFGQVLHQVAKTKYKELLLCVILYNILLLFILRRSRKCKQLNIVCH